MAIVRPDQSSGGGGGGTVKSVKATDTSIVVAGTATDPTIATATLDVIAADHPPAADWSNNAHKITGLANGSAAQDAAAFGQLGRVLDFVSRSTDLTVTATSAATAQAWIDGNAVTYDGATRVLVEVSAALITGNTDCILELYDGATDIGRHGQVSGASATVRGGYVVTPTAGSHTFHVKAWKAGPGGLITSSLGVASWYRIVTMP